MASNAQQIKDLTKAVADLASNFDDVRDSLSEFSKGFADSIRPAKDLDKQLKSIRENLVDTLSDTEKMGDKLKAVAKTSKEISRLEWDFTKPEEMRKAAGYLEDMNIKAKELLGTKKLTSEVESQLEAHLKKMNDLQAKLNGSAVLTADEAKQFRRELEESSLILHGMVASSSAIDFKGAKAGMTSLGSAIGSIASTLKDVKSFQFKSLTDSFKKMRQDSFEMKKNMVEGGKAYRELKKFKTEYAKANGPEDKKAILSEFAAKGLTEAKGRGGLVAGGFIDKALTNLMEKRVTGGKGQGLMKMFMQGGGSITGGIGASIMSMMSKMSPMLQVFGALMEAIGSVAKQRKETFGALGKGGLIAGGDVNVRGVYRGMQNVLSPKETEIGGFEASIMGMNYEKNLEVMKALVENGIGVGGMHQGKGALEAVSQKGPATTAMSGIMRNAYVFGQNLGMSPQESVALTVKAVGEFNQSFKETEDLFIRIDEGVAAAGISTTKYLGIVDQITGQFSRFNKTLSESVAMITAMGKSSKYTAEYMAEMLKSVMGGTTSLEQKAYAYESIDKGALETKVNAQKTRVGGYGEKLSGLIGVTPEKLDTMEEADIADAVNKAIKSKGIDAGTAKEYGAAQNLYTTGKTRLLAQQQALASGDMVGLAGIEEFGGSDQQGKIAVNMALMNRAISNRVPGGNIGTFSNMKERAKLMADTSFAMELKATGVEDVEGMYQALPAATHQLAGVWGAKNMPGAKTKDVEASEEFQRWLASGAGMQGLIDKIEEGQRQAAKEKAKENWKAITDPMEIIQNILKSVMDQLVKILEVIINWFSFDAKLPTFAEMEEGRAYSEKTGFATTGGATIEKVADEALKKNPELKYVINNAKESILLTKKADAVGAATMADIVEAQKNWTNLQTIIKTGKLGIQEQAETPGTEQVKEQKTRQKAAGVAKSVGDTPAEIAARGESQQKSIDKVLKKIEENDLGAILTKGTIAAKPLIEEIENYRKNIGMASTPAERQKVGDTFEKTINNKFYNVDARMLRRDLEGTNESSGELGWVAFS